MLYNPWTSYLRLGLVHFMAYPEVATDESRVLPTLMELAADTDFEVVEVKGVSDPALRHQIRALCEAARLDIAYGAQPLVLGQKLNANSAITAERARAMQSLKTAVDEAVEMGAKGLVFLSGPDPGQAGRLAAQSALIEFLIELCQYADQAGQLPIILEVFDRDIDKKAFVGPHALAADITRAVRVHAPNFGLLVDLSHTPLLNESARAALQVTKDYLVHAHIGNCVMRNKSHPAYGDMHPRFGVADGENDVDELTDYIEWLFRVGYLGVPGSERPVLSFEVKPMPGESSQSVIAGAKRTLAAAWAKIQM